MGSGASIQVPPEFATLSEEEQKVLQSMFDELRNNGKSDADALAEVASTFKYKARVQPGKEVNIPLPKLLEVCQMAIDKGLTPLVVDNSEDNKVDTFFSYRSCVILDGKKLGLDKTMNKIPIPDIMEEARTKIVAALKFGNILYIPCQQACVDFEETWTDEAINAKDVLDFSDGKVRIV